MELASKALILGCRVELRSKGLGEDLPGRKELAVNLHLRDGQRRIRRTRPSLPLAVLLGLRGWDPLCRLRDSWSRGSILLGLRRSRGVVMDNGLRGRRGKWSRWGRVVDRLSGVGLLVVPRGRCIYGCTPWRRSHDCLPRELFFTLTGGAFHPVELDAQVKLLPGLDKIEK
ncbi:hypothetical protein CRG98_003730 [Punica granatum]|uniref:Uncharacterized protein n=1 Tax=Punica granatum TaxID=22663 RepID=A0A2I0L534_PUNGR|nr:hypothetical protein CRG98_003730 [Punica granatum]